MKISKSICVMAIAASMIAFNATAGRATTVTFDGLVGGGYNNYGTSLTVDGVTFGQPGGRLFVFGPTFYNTTGLTSDYLNNNAGSGGLTITLPYAVTAFSADIGLQNNYSGATTPNLTFTFGSTSETLTLPYYLAYSSNPLITESFTSSTPFTTITIADPLYGLALDNFTFASAQTPLPAALPLFATGLAGLGLLGWRRKRKAQAVA